MMSTPVSENRHIVIPQTSWSGTLFWYTTGLVRPIARIKRYFSPIPTPPKGPQVWAFPPPKALNRLMNTGKGEQAVAEQWEHGPSGYNMTAVLPPLVSGQKKATSRSILYFHGSAFQLPPISWHWGYAAYLARELDAEVILVPYPLAPTNNAFDAMPTLTKVYEAFLDRAGEREAIIAGDSAGGAIALCLAFAAHDAKIPLPSQIIAISPLVNLAQDNPDMAHIEQYDHMLSREYCRKAALLWVDVPIPQNPANGTLYSVPMPEETLRNPHINPSAGDLSVLAKAGTKLILASGSWEVLHPDIALFADKAREAGVETTFIEGTHQFHTFPIPVNISPECRRAAELINQQVVENSRTRSPQP